MAVYLVWVEWQHPDRIQHPTTIRCKCVAIAGSESEVRSSVTKRNESLLEGEGYKLSDIAIVKLDGEGDGVVFLSRNF